jgi:predicted Rossmann fold flavoprotein
VVPLARHPTSILIRYNFHGIVIDVAVIGGGAAGLVAALQAARGGAKTVLLESTERIGAKILISGGGRCNVLPGKFDDRAFFTSGSRNVLKRIFRTWPHHAVREFFEQDLNIPLKLEKEFDKLFPVADKARVIRDGLLQAAQEAGVEVRCGWPVESVESVKSRSNPDPSKESNHAEFLLRSSRGDCLSATKVILATGGKSVPKTGSDGHGYKLAQALGHTILPTYPALVPLTGSDPRLLELSGLTLPVRWQAKLNQKVVETGTHSFLFTHKGYSGPAALNASHHYARDQARIEIAWDPVDENTWQQRLAKTQKTTLTACLSKHIPKRLAVTLLEIAQLDPELKVAQLSKDKRKALLDHLLHFPLPINGDQGFRVAEVTGGGIPLDQINPSTLESRRCPNLYLCGEILDTIGQIGGHNFLWAFVTGHLAGSVSR